MKKLTSLLLALVLTLALTIPAFAAEPQKLIAENPASQAVQVILNNRTVSFPDQKPELKTGRTMVPYRALMETLGGVVKYDESNDTIVCQLGDTKVTFAAGGDTVTAETKGEVTTAKMDVPCYIKNGRTYVPIRFFTEVLGYDVFWDSDDHAAVVVDKQKLIDQIDKEFSILNEALENLNVDQTKNYKSHLDYDIIIDMKNPEDETETLHMALNLKLDMVQNKDSVECKGTMDATPILEAINMDELVKEELITKEQAELIEKTAGDLEFTMLYSIKTGIFAVNVPALADIMPELTGMQVSADTWYTFDLGMGDLSAYSNYQSVGNLLYLMQNMMCETDNTLPAQLWNDLLEMAKEFKDVLGDDSFKKIGSTNRWKMNKYQMAKLLGDEAFSDTMEDFDVQLDVKQDGSMALKFDVMTCDYKEVDLPGMKAQGECSVSKSDVSFNMTLAMGDMGTFTYDVNGTIIPTTKEPMTALPEGVPVVNLNAMAAMMMAPEAVEPAA